MAYNFPRVKRATETTILEQIDKIIEEAQEIRQAFLDEEGSDRILEETWDTVQACEGLFRKFKYQQVMDAKSFVINKTEEREDYVITT